MIGFINCHFIVSYQPDCITSSMYFPQISLSVQQFQLYSYVCITTLPIVNKLEPLVYLKCHRANRK
jgi:hypothetical protein